MVAANAVTSNVTAAVGSGWQDRTRAPTRAPTGPMGAESVSLGA